MTTKDYVPSSQVSRTDSWNTVLKKLFPLMPTIPMQKWMNDFIKRSFDILVSLAVLILLAPVFLLIAIAIKRDTPGPVFYRGSRIGKNFKMFKILKFRTMYEDPKSYAGPSVTAHDDERITPLGRWLRDTKINEFPQFWNVLKGEMSLVGPRPEDPNLAKTWPVDLAHEIMSVKPGITSPASVLYRNEETLLSIRDVLQKYLKDLSPDKMRLDQLYVRHHSFWLDLDVLLWTFLIILPIIGSFSPPEELLFVGPVTRLIRRYVNWFTVDLIVSFIAISIAHFSWLSFHPGGVAWNTGLGYGIIFSILFSAIGLFTGINKIKWSKASTSDTTQLLRVWLVASIFSLGLNLLLQIYPVKVIYAASGISLIGFLMVRLNSRFAIFFQSHLIRYLQAGIATERVLIVGSGRTAESISWVLNHPTYSDKFFVAGFVDNDLFAKGMRIYGANILGNVEDVPDLVKKHDVGIVILADNRIAMNDYQTILEFCEKESIRLVVIPDVFGSLNHLLVHVPSAMQVPSDEIAVPFPAPTMANGHASPCRFCVGRYTRLEMEAQNKIKEGILDGEESLAR